jgi:hypothetical protein
MRNARIGVVAAALLVATNTFGSSSARSETQIGANGHVAFWTSSSNEIVRLVTKIRTPPTPEPAGTVFLWPGLQPHPEGRNFLPIDNGVLQPVLTWGPSCAKGEQPKRYSTWWISAQYVNKFGRYRGYTGCQGGPIMSAKPGDTLSIEMSLSGSQWMQRIRNSRTGKSVSFAIDLLGQAQIFAYFDIEPAKQGGPYVADVTFSDTTISFARADARDCRVRARGDQDYVSPPVSRKLGKECYIEKIVLKSRVRPTAVGPSCREVGTARSSSGQDRTTITFKNERGLPVRLCWINYAGARRLCRRLANGETHEQPTFLTHPWVVTDLNHTCIGLYWPSSPAREHLIR